MFPKKSITINKPMLFLSNAVIFAVFTMVYWLMDREQPGVHFGPEFDPVYFSVITHTTIGFGDVYPVSKSARYVTAMHATLTLVFTLYFI